MEEVGAQLGFAQLVGGGTKMPGEARDHRDVRLDRPLGVAAKMEVIDQALAQGSHVILSGKGRRGSEQRLDARSTRRDRYDQHATSIRRRRIEFNAPANLRASQIKGAGAARANPQIARQVQRSLASSGKEWNERTSEYMSETAPRAGLIRRPVQESTSGRPVYRSSRRDRNRCGEPATPGRLNSGRQWP